MRKFDSVNLKRKKFERRPEPPLVLPKESDFVFAPPQKRRIKYSYINVGNEHFINLKNFAKTIVWLIIIIVIVYIGKQAFKTQKSLLALQDSMEKGLEQAQSYAGNGNMEGSLGQLDQLQSDITKSKLIAQAWGQDVSYFQYLPGRKSSLTQKEVLLTTGYDVINLSREIREDISSLQKNSITISSTSSYDIDLALIGNRVSKIVKKVDKRVSVHRRNLKGMDSAQAEKIAKNLDDLSAQTLGLNAFLKNDLPWISGADGKEKNVMLIFQNNGELRGGSGGSLGSFGTLKFSNGSLSDISFGTNIFKIDKEFKTKTHIDPPDIIQFLNKDWVLKDAGWSVDGPTAFTTIEDFYTKETGKNVDGVIVLDATFFENLLEKLGPINLPQYGKEIDSKNFRSEIEKEVHDTYFDRPGGNEENEPKKILAEMMPLVMDKFFKSLSDQNKFAGILGTVNDGLSQKHVLLYLNNPDLQKMIENNNWSGKVESSQGDYLYVNNSNIDGGKSSVNMNELINLDASIGIDGMVTNKLKVERDYAIQNGDKNNINFVRLGLPQDATVGQFKPIEGNFEQFWNKGYKENKISWQTNEFSKTWLNFWMSTAENKKSQMTLDYFPGYKLTLGDSFDYQILVQKQPGSLDDTFILKLNYPNGYKPVNIKNYDAQNHSAEIKLTLKNDLNIKIKFIRE